MAEFDEDLLTLNQQKDISDAIAASQLVIGNLESPSLLLPAYENAHLHGFVPGIHYLSSKYQFMRKVRGDGNCFYRAFLFAYLEGLLIENNNERVEKEIIRIKQLLNDSKIHLIELGYSIMAFEAFYDVSYIIFSVLHFMHIFITFIFFVDVS